MAVDLEKLAGQFRASAYNAYSNTLIGNAPIVVQRAYRRMTDVKVGDLVIECTTVYMKNRPNLDGIGELLSITYEPIPYDPPWDGGEPCPKEKVYTIKTLDDRTFRWTNAMFISVLTEIQGF